MNYKRKSRRRFFLLMCSRTPPISSEFRGGGFEHPPPRYATALLPGLFYGELYFYLMNGGVVSNFS